MMNDTIWIIIIIPTQQDSLVTIDWGQGVLKEIPRIVSLHFLQKLQLYCSAIVVLSTHCRTLSPSKTHTVKNCHTTDATHTTSHTDSTF